MLVFRLKKPFINIGKEEILALFKNKIKKNKTIDNFFICSLKNSKKNKKLDRIEKNISKIAEKRLGFCHEIYKLIFISEKKDFLIKLKKTNFLKHYKKDFCVRYHGFFYMEKEIADLVYNNIKKIKEKEVKKNQNIKVNLTNPKTKFVFYEIGNKIIALLFLSEIDKTYNERKAHLRPGFHPTSLSPDLARACINLTGLNKGIIFDPFCGTSGILIESALMGFYVIGNDIIKKQILYSKKNFNFYKIKNYKLYNKDILKFNFDLIFNNKSIIKKTKNKNLKNFFSIVSDLPYGKGSYAKDLYNLYETFLIKIRNELKREKIENNLVLIFPDFVDYKKIIKKTKFNIKKEFFYYVHKSLTRVIVVLTQN